MVSDTSAVEADHRIAVDALLAVLAVLSSFSRPPGNRDRLLGEDQREVIVPGSWVAPANSSVLRLVSCST